MIERDFRHMPPALTRQIAATVNPANVNFEVCRRYRLARQFWWHVTEITLDHLRPSPEWKKAMAELELAKSREAATLRRENALTCESQRALAEMLKQDEDKHQMLREALEDLAARDRCPF